MSAETSKPRYVVEAFGSKFAVKDSSQSPATVVAFRPASWPDPKRAAQRLADELNESDRVTPAHTFEP